MINFIKMFGIIALIAVIGFTLIACGGDDNGGSSGGGSGALGEKLELSGQVYKGGWDDNWSFVYSNFGGNLTITENSKKGGQGAVIGGKFDFVIETPNNLYPIENHYSLGSIFSNYDDLETTPSEVNWNYISYFSTVEGESLYRGDRKESGSFNNYTETEDYVTYIYVDKDVTISAKGKEKKEIIAGFDVTFTTKNFSIKLTEGWNAVRFNTIRKGTSSTETNTETVSISNPSLRWFFYDFGW